MKELSVTVVGAEYPVNLGYTARLMKNFGVSRLYLVAPKCDMRAASVYASHGSDILDKAEVASLRKVRGLHDFLLATTAIRARRGANVGRTAIKPEEAAALLARAESASIVLGRDTTGLTNEEVALCDLVTTVETGTHYRTLNVSHAAAILLYLVTKADSREGGPLRCASQAPRRDREAFSRYAHRLAIASGLPKHKAERMAQVAGRVALKSEVNSKELGLLVSLMRKAEFAIEKAGR